MTAALGGGYHYESPESRALGDFKAEKFAYRDQGKNLIQLNNAVGFMSGMMRKMQRGIDDANKNFVQQIQGFITDFIVMLGGGGDTGLDFGDLKYVIQAIGALFGFADENGNITVPVNLFNAAWHFFSNYIGVTGNFRELIDQLIDNAIATVLDLFGEVPIAGQALQQLAAFISDIRDLLDPIAAALQTFLEAFDIELDDLDGIADFFGPFKPIVQALLTALDGVNLPDFTATFHEIAQWTTPFVMLIAAGITVVSTFIKLLTGAADADDFAAALKAVSLAVDPTINGGNGYDTIAIGIGIIQHLLDPTGLLAGANWGDLFTTLTGGAAGSNPLNDLGNFLKGQFSGQINPNRLGALPLTALGNFAANLLDNPSFLDANAIANPGNFTYDATHGHTSNGCAVVTANGTTKTLYSNYINVDPGATFNVGSWIQYDNLTVSGANAITVNVLAYNGTALINTTQIGSIGTAGTIAWTQRQTTYTAPATATKVVLQLKVANTATSGTIRFDDGLFSPTRLLQLGWIDGLLGYLSKLNPLGLFDASGLTNMPGIPAIPGLDKLPALGTLVDSATNALSGASQTGQEIVGAGVDMAKETMQNLYEMLTATTRKVQALETAATANAVGGRQFNINFADYPDGGFPAGVFNVTYSGAGSSALAISGGKAVWNKVNDGYRRATMIFPLTTLTSFQVVRGTMSSPPEQGTNVRIWSLGRMNATGTDFVFARGYCTGFLQYKGDIGCYQGGVEKIWASGISLTWSLDLRVIMGVGTNARRHMVLSGDTVVWDGMEPADKQSSIDASHLYWGAITETDGAHVPGAVAGASTVDNAPPAVVGTTFKASKRTGGDMTISSGQQPVPNNFYETVDYISPDLTYRPGTNCELECTKQGTYIVIWRCYHGNFSTGTGGVGLLWKKPSGGTWGPVERSVWGTNPINVGFGVMADSTDATCGMAMVPMNPGDVLRPGFVFTANMSNTGDNVLLADGSQSYFAVTRVGT